MPSWFKLAERLVSAVERLADAAEMLVETAAQVEADEIRDKHEVPARR